MSFLGALFDNPYSRVKTADLTNAVSNQQAQQSIGASQNALAQQAAFAQALAGQNGIANQSNVYNQLAGVAAGTGPNPAQAQLAQATGANVANQAALMASQRGTAQNAGMLARQAAQQGGALQQQAAGQGATMQAQQSLNAINAMGGIAGQQVGQQANALSGLNAAAQSQQGQMLNTIQNQNALNLQQTQGLNQVNTGIYQNQMGSAGGLFGGILKGVSGAVGLGGKAHGGLIESYADGGEVKKQPKADASPTPPYEKDNKVAKGISDYFNKMADGGVVDPAHPDHPDFLSNFLSGATSDSPTPGMESLGEGLGRVAGAFKPKMKQAIDAPAPIPAAMVTERVMSPQNALVAAFSRGGMPISGEMLEAKGAKVPGKPKVKGDNEKNDTVPAMLSPGEIVIPRSIANHPNAPEMAAKFVAQVLAKSAKKR